MPSPSLDLNLHWKPSWLLLEFEAFGGMCCSGSSTFSAYQLYQVVQTDQPLFNSNTVTGQKIIPLSYIERHASWRAQERSLTKQGRKLTQKDRILETSCLQLVIKEQLGAGSFAKVFRGYLGPPVAVKRWEPLDDRVRTAGCVHSELRILSQLPQHPNILSFIGESTALTEGVLNGRCCACMCKERL